MSHRPPSLAPIIRAALVGSVGSVSPDLFAIAGPSSYFSRSVLYYSLGTVRLRCPDRESGPFISENPAVTNNEVLFVLTNFFRC